MRLKASNADNQSAHPQATVAQRARKKVPPATEPAEARRLHAVYTTTPKSELGAAQVAKVRLTTASR